MAQIRTSHISTAIVGTMAAVVAVFVGLFVSTLYQVFGDISTAANFFGSADVMMYLTIEGLFLACVIIGAFFVIRK